MDEMIGKKLDGRYLLQSLVGVGGMANVYKAEDLKTQHTVAVKILREEFLKNEELVRRFKNESKTISVLNHPNIVKVFDVSVTDKLNYIVIEYIDGITLKEYMTQRGGPLTWKEVVHFTTQVLNALEHAHAQGVVHRDVKPQNIMLQADGTLKMMDFGIARFSRAQSVAESGKAIGSVHYISPEQASGALTGATTDIYSVGVMMYEMLSGRLPFDSEDAVAVAIKQIADKAPSLAQLAPSVPTALVEITERAMAKKPVDRYQSAREMLDDFQTFKHNPDIRFEYQYLTEDSPTRYIDKVVKKAKGETNSSRATDERRTSSRQGTARRSAEGSRRGSARTPQKKKKGFPFFGVLFGITAACVVVTILLCYFIFSNSTNALFSNRDDVQLTNFVGMTKEQVQQDENSKKLNIKFDEEYSSNYEAGVIYSQTPKDGRTVKEGQQVTLKVSLGTKYVVVPNVANMLQADAQQEMKNQDLTVSVRPNYTSEATVGTVVETDPAAGTELASGSTVILYVSKEKVDTNRTVPDITGLSVEDAQTALQNSGLVLGIQTEGYSDLPAGTIYQQGVAPETQVRVNTGIDVGVSIGPEPAQEGNSGDENEEEKELWWFLPEDQRPKTW